MSKAGDRQSPLRVAQITDCHLGERVGSRLLNLDTDQSLAAVLGLIRAKKSLPDVLLVTGDLSDQGSAAAYRRVLQATRDIGAHARWLPGNHDDPATMSRAIGADPRLQRNLLVGNWQIIMLDSSVRGEVGGFLGADELIALRACLDAYPDRFALICVHHHVLPIGCAWLDRQIVINAHALWSVLDDYPQVRAVVSGHVHQRSETTRNAVQIITSPSTCVQFAPHSDEFRIDHEMPGYRWFDLHADGRLRSGVERVAGYDYQVDMTAAGY